MLSGERKRALLAALLKKRAERADRFPLSFGQQRLWFLHRLDQQSPAYNCPLGIRFDGPLDPAILQKAIATVVERHEVLRTTFREGPDGPLQVVNPQAPVNLTVIDLGEKVRTEAELRPVLVAEARRSFDLVQGPLFRTTLFRLAADKHILVFNLHHVIGDGWSLEVLFRELSSLYEAFSADQASPLPPLPIQYADFAAWQQQRLTCDALREQLNWWVEHLGRDSAPLELPTDRPRPPVQTTNGTREPFVIPAALTEGLRRLAQREGATLFMVLLAAYKLLLYRHTGMAEIAVGSPLAGRNRAELEGLIGMFVNTLVLKTPLTGNPTFRELLQRVRNRALDAYDRQEVPFEKLVERLQPERTLSCHPLFQTLFALYRPPPEGRWRGTAWKAFDVPTDTAKFDLSFVLTERADEITGEIEYNTDVFDVATMRRWAAQLQALLASILANPDLPIDELNLLPEGERRQLLVDWNSATCSYPRDRRLHELFEEQARRTPDAPALVFERERITYRELEMRAERLAAQLRELEVGPETLVGVLLERTPRLLVAILGILKAGGAYVPLDPVYPKDRLEFIFDDTRMPILLTQPELSEQLPAAAETGVLYLDASGVAAPAAGRAPRRKPYRSSAHPFEIAPAPTNLAYVIYTSGSTGRPKGVAVEHRSVVALIAWARTVFRAEDFAGALASTSICFDVSVFELFVPLCVGGTVILAENVLQLPVLPAAAEVVMINTVPSAMQELIRSRSLPASVQTVVLAGEPLPQRLVDELYAVPTIARVFDIYGPTEDTVYSTWTLRRRGGRATIGRPIANEQAYIVDARMRPVPIGIPGELCLAGDGLARGYLHRPELTAEKFTENPFAPGRPLYHTGDLARFDADGNIEYLGRLDHQVKVRGRRIELGEIESVLRQHADVHDCLVVVREDTPGDKNLVAYVVAGGAPPPDRRILRLHLHHKLPDYMVPSAFVFLPKMPLLANGKIDRKALPAPELGSSEPTVAFVAPRTPAEAALAKIWCELLRVEQVGANDNFFQLGGHSLLVMRMMARIVENFGVQLPLRAAFGTPTLGGLASVIEEAVLTEVAELGEDEAERVSAEVEVAR
jgi:amino acid adenylation domain-containing protein